ncbi:MAG: lipopolysaccharide transport periplasmic protein LptA [Alteromonadaceae bacterium]|nr:lipopolysaccharide transport periplasmic protein LptA [Alteromonadaceae bacterium]
MYKRLINLLTSALLALSPALVLAKQADFSQPIEIKSESQFLDGKLKKLVLINDVQITQGTLNILADRLEVEDHLGKGKEIFTATGRPAYYRQELDDGKIVEAEAFEIRYEVATRTISLTGKAKLNQNARTVTAESITYDMEKEQFKATGSGDGEGRRVTTIYSMEPEETPPAQSDSDEQDDDNE